MNDCSLSPINCLHMSDSVLCDFVISHPNGVHIKDAKNGSYLLCNQKPLENFGLTKTEQLIGQNVFDADKFMRPYWGNNYAEQIAEMDYMVKTRHEVFTKKYNVSINAHNKIYIQDITKIPLVSSFNKVTAILTILNDHTKKANYFYLLDLYKNMYPNQAIGLSSFIKYLGLSDFFQEHLTYREITCLLHMRLDSSRKSIANKLNIGVKTVETHISHITGKLKYGRLSTILNHLRSQEIL